MSKLILRIAVLLFLLTRMMVSSGQTVSLITADSLASGTAKDVFKSFFQLAFNRIISDNKEIEFTANPFAVMARANPKLVIDTSYLRYRQLRRLNFSFAAKLDSAYKFNGFASSFKYAIIDRRDETVSREFVNAVSRSELLKLNEEVSKFVSQAPAADRVKYNEEQRKFFRGNAKFSELDTVFAAKIRELAEKVGAVKMLEALNNDQNLNGAAFAAKTYETLRDQFQQGWLWTVGVSDTTYKDEFFFSNIVVSSELLKGVTQPNKKHAFELNLQSRLQFNDDSLVKGRDLKRLFFNMEPGVNLLLKTGATQYPWLEFKMSGSYIHGFNNLYANERRDSLTINGTLRIRVFGDIWIPLEIKYDPKSGNVFGFLDIRANFNSLKNILGKKEQ